jgi:uncharacterized protein involved in outer membrane biogenesis
MKKFVIGGSVALLVIVIVVILSYVLTNLDSLVAKAIEKHGSEVTGTSVRVSGVDVSLSEGRGSIEGLSVANPEGFSGTRAFQLGNITVDLDLESVRSNPIVLDEVRIQAPMIHAEIAKDGKTNIGELRRHIEAFTGTGDSQDKGGKAQKRIRIKSFIFEEGKIAVDATALDADKIDITLPAIRLENLGGAGGAPPEVIVKQVLTVLTQDAGKAIAHSEINHLIGEELGDALPDKAKSLLKKLGSDNK